MLLQFCSIKMPDCMVQDAGVQKLLMQPDMVPAAQGAVSPGSPPALAVHSHTLRHWAGELCWQTCWGGRSLKTFSNQSQLQRKQTSD